MNGQAETNKKPLERFFHYEERGSSLSKELIGGLVTFLAMCYILPVNSALLAGAGMDEAGVFASTAFVSFFATVLMALVGKVPLALSAGMGLNAFLAYTICGSLGYSWQEGLLLSTFVGIIFFLLSISKLREKLMAAFPKDLKHIISAGLGAFIAFVGLKGAGIVVSDPGTFVTLGSLSQPSVVLALFGVFFAFFFVHFAKGPKMLRSLAIPLSMLVTAVLGYAIRWIIVASAGAESPLLTGLPDVSFTSGWGVSGFENVIFYGYLGNDKPDVGFGTLLLDVLKNPATYALLFSMVFVQLFDTTAGLLTLGRELGIVDEKGDLTDKSVLLGDSLGGLFCAPFGTATVTSFSESAIGIRSGARTGLASLVTAFLLLISAFIYPVFQLFTASSVTACALLTVGGLIVSGNLGTIDWKDPSIGFSAFVTVLLIVLTYSLTNGIGLGLLAYLVIRLAQGKGKETHWVLYLVGALYLVSFAVNELVKHL